MNSFLTSLIGDGGPKLNFLLPTAVLVYGMVDLNLVVSYLALGPVCISKPFYGLSSALVVLIDPCISTDLPQDLT